MRVIFDAEQPEHMIFPFGLNSVDMRGDFAIFSHEPPSNDMKSIFGDDGRGGPVECDLCARIHFSSEKERYDKQQELADLEKKMAEMPDKYHSHDGTIHVANILGATVVVNCPCNGLECFEKLFISEQGKISEFLITYTASCLREARENHESALEAYKAVHS